MKYSKNYPKLSEDTYTTIRRHYHGKRWSLELEEYPGGYHTAQITMVRRLPFNRIGTALLLKDTDCKTRPEALEFINSFYHEPINPIKEKLYVYTMKKVTGY